MDLTNKLPKIKDQEKESKFGYVFAVSGPGKSQLVFEHPPKLIKYARQFLNLFPCYFLCK